MKCIQDLYKSTYRGLAFIEGKEYEVADDDEDFIWVIDEKNNEFSFAKEDDMGPYYYVGEYFALRD